MIGLKRSFCPVIFTVISIGLTAFHVPSMASPPLVPYPVTLEAGSAAEQSAVLQSSGSTIVNGARMAEVGQFWAYGFAVNPGEACLLTLKTDDAGKGALPNVSVPAQDGKPIAIRLVRAQDGSIQISWTVPEGWPIGGKMEVVIGAKTEPIRVTSAILSVRQPDREGIPASVSQLMLQGLPPSARISIASRKGDSRPFTALQTPRPPEQPLDIPTDSIFVYSTNGDAIQGWKSRGFTVWTMGGSRADKAYAEKHPAEMQVQANGLPRTIGGDSYYLTPTANRSEIEKSYYETAISLGSLGVCPEEPEFYANAGYSDAFKQAWKLKYKTDWQAPDSGIDASYRAAQLMAGMETEHISSVLKAADGHPGVRRMVALHSPINYAQWAIIAPQHSITGLPGIQDVIGQVWTGTARTPVRYKGIRSDRTFSLAYLEYSSLYQLVRSTGKRLWFLMDPLEDDPGRAQADYKSHYEQTLIASLLFPDVDSYEVMPWPERIYGHVPGDYATEIGSVIAALQDMHDQHLVEGNPATGASIGLLVSDSMQFQRAGVSPSDFDGVFGLTLPLLERGVPVQAVSLDRAAEPGYLKPFKTLLLSCDFQKPSDPQAVAALAEWVRRGGTLLVVGGSDAYNALADSWWARSNLKNPCDELWNRLGVVTGAPARSVRAPLEDLSGYEVVAKTDGSEHNLRNRKRISIDLTRFCADTGSVAVRFADATPQDGWGPYVTAAELRVNGKLAASFAAGSDIESRFLVYDRGSEYNGEARFADKSASFTYQFDNIPAGASVQFTVEVGNGYLISASPVEPIFGHTLIGTNSSPALKKAFPRLRIGNDYPATIYPSVAAVPDATPAPRTNAPGPPTPLYTLRSGGTAIWMRTAGEGLAIQVGVAPGFFTTSSRSAGLLRALVQYGFQRAGGVYREPGSLRLRRGRYTIIHTFQSREQVEGRTIDILSPSLNVAEDRVIPPNSEALLYDLGDEDEAPHLGFVSGRVEAKVEIPTSTCFYTRGPSRTTGVARLHSGGHAIAGVKAMDRLGRPVDIQAEAEGSTVLLRYANDPDGVVVRVGWKL